MARTTLEVDYPVPTFRTATKVKLFDRNQYEASFDQSYFDNNQRGDESNKKFNLQILSFKDSNKINHNSSITSDYKQSLISLSKIV